MKSKIKANRIHLKRLGIEFSDEEWNKIEGKVIERKQMFFDDEYENPVPHDQDQYSIGKISTLSIDSDGDIVIPTAMSVERYKKNPVVLFNHDLNYPIGRAEKIKVTNVDVIAKTRYARTEEAKRIHQLLVDKVLRTHSVGFITIEAIKKGERGFNEVFAKLAQAHPERFNENNQKQAERIITKALLVEYSVVTIPANEDCIIDEIKSLKEKSAEYDVNEWKSLQDYETDDDGWISLEESIFNDNEKYDEEDEEDKENEEEMHEFYNKSNEKSDKCEIKVIKRAPTINRLSTKEERQKRIQKELRKHLHWAV